MNDESEVTSPADPVSTPGLPANTYLSLPGVARRLSVSESSVRRWIKSGDLPAKRVGPGGRYRISSDAVSLLLTEPDR